MNNIDYMQVVRGFLETQSTLALATVNDRGEPEAAPVFFVSDDTPNLYWLSSPDSRHSLNLTARAGVAAAVYPTVWQWKDIIGLQIEGVAQIVTDERIREQILNLYFRKFKLPGELDTIITGSTLYVLRPRWFRWLDNSVNFGHKVEIRP